MTEKYPYAKTCAGMYARLVILCNVFKRVISLVEGMINFKIYSF